MFIRSKMVKGHRYYQVVEGVREGDRVRQRTLVWLGSSPTIPSAIHETRKKLRRLKVERERYSWNRHRASAISRTERITRAIDKAEARLAIMLSLRDRPIVGTTAKAPPPRRALAIHGQRARKYPAVDRAVDLAVSFDPSWIPTDEEAEMLEAISWTAERLNKFISTEAETRIHQRYWLKVMVKRRWKQLLQVGPYDRVVDAICSKHDNELDREVDHILQVWRHLKDRTVEKTEVLPGDEIHQEVFRTDDAGSWR